MNHSTKLESRNILIVDDDPEILSILHDLLRDLGSETFKATNGLEAIEVCRTKRIDVILTDLKMPEMDGLSFLKMIRDHDLHTPTIILTGFNSVEMQIRANKLGAYIIFEKPYLNADLIYAVKQALNDKHTVV